MLAVSFGGWCELFERLRLFNKTQLQLWRRALPGGSLTSLRLPRVIDSTTDGIAATVRVGRSWKYASGRLVPKLCRMRLNVLSGRRLVAAQGASTLSSPVRRARFYDAMRS